MKIKVKKNFKATNRNIRTFFEAGKEYDVDKEVYDYAFKNGLIEVEKKAVKEVENKAVKEAPENKGFFGKKKKKKVKPVIKKAVKDDADA